MVHRPCRRKSRPGPFRFCTSSIFYCIFLYLSYTSVRVIHRFRPPSDCMDPPAAERGSLAEARLKNRRFQRHSKPFYIHCTYSYLLSVPLHLSFFYSFNGFPYLKLISVFSRRMITQSGLLSIGKEYFSLRRKSSFSRYAHD